MHRNTGKFLGIKFTMVFFLKVQRDKMKPACPSVYISPEKALLTKLLLQDTGKVVLKDLSRLGLAP